LDVFLNDRDISFPKGRKSFGQKCAKVTISQANIQPINCGFWSPEFRKSRLYLDT